MVVFEQKCCIWAEEVVLGQSRSVGAKWLSSGKSSCIREKVVAFGLKCLYSGKVVVLGEKWLYSGKSRCIRAKLLS